ADARSIGVRFGGGNGVARPIDRGREVALERSEVCRVARRHRCALVWQPQACGWLESGPNRGDRTAACERVREVAMTDRLSRRVLDHAPRRRLEHLALA